MITPVAIDTIGYKYYIDFAVVGFCIQVSVYFLYPEVSFHFWIDLAYWNPTDSHVQTMGLSLEDVDLIFRQSPSVLSTVKYAKQFLRRTGDIILDEKEKIQCAEGV
jgi:hypothetical protein